MEINKVYLGDSLEIIKNFPDESIDCVVTSPPYYGLRDYGVAGQIGLEYTPSQYIERLVSLFREIRRCLKKDGTIWVNIGDSYNNTAPGNKNPHGFSQNRPSYTNYETKKMREKKLVNGIKQKDLIGIPWMLAFALRADGWYLRQDIIWHKPNPMPESVTDRCTKSHEYIFLFSKNEKYYFDYEAIMEPCSEKQTEHYIGKNYYGNGTKKERTHEQGYSQKENGGHRDNSGGFDCEMSIKDGVVVRNKRDVWNVPVRPNKESHFATYPEMLIRPCILAGCAEGGIVLDPFMGSGTTGIVARKLNRNYVGCELNPEYQKMAERRILEQGENLFNQ